MRFTGLAVLTAAMCLFAPTAASAQSQAAQAQSSGGGASTGGNIRHVTSTGLGMAVGRSAQGNIVAYNGFLARSIASRDTRAPVFDPPPQNIQAAVAQNAAACAATVAFPAVRVVDNRDRNPVITAVLSTQPPRNLNPAGEMVAVPPGSYDVLLTATDRAGNRAQASYRVVVTDSTLPTLANIPDPTPVGNEAEATSPAGTLVNIVRPVCSDVCDPAPVLTSNAPARYPLGDTNVDWTCVDASGNRAAAARTVVRVRDRLAPTVAGGAPADFAANCNDPAGSSVRVPAIAWQDNSANAAELELSLIVNPAGANVAYMPIPANVTLTGGLHILRYVARDPSGNRAQYDLRVTISDVTVPRVTVVNAPQTGWYNADADVQVRVSDNCSSLASGLRVSVMPPPQGQAVNGDILTLRYTTDGIINLTVTATDSANNEVTDNSVAFGIDRGPPNASVVVPSQVGVAANNPLTWPLFPLAETLPLNVGADDPGDGQVSGVRRVQVFLDPDAQGRPTRTLADVTYPGNGAPTRGARVQGNVRCTDNRAGDAGAVCNAEGAVELRKLRVGAHVLRTVVTDFAGSVTTLDARLTNANLYEGLDIVAGRIGQRLRPEGGLPAAVLQELTQALADLQRGRTVAARQLPGSPYGTPLFLGSALKAVQDATVDLDQGIVAAPAAVQPLVVDYVSLVHRIAKSDVTLYRAFIEGRNLPATFVGADAFLLAEYATDMANSANWLTEMGTSMDAQDWNSSAAAGLEAFFGLKSAATGWMMNYAAPFDPSPEAYLAEYARGRAILDEMQQEIAAYTALPQPPGLLKMQQMRDDLDQIVSDLDLLIEGDFDTPNGLSDQNYLEDLINLQVVASSSQTAANQGVWVRNYQWAMMQVVRYMAYASTTKAISINAVTRRAWPLFRFATQRINEGVAFLNERRVQEAINLYLDALSTCSIAAVYHCHYLKDEATNGRMDLDQPYTADPVQGCWNVMLRPDEWAAAPAPGPREPPAECRFGQNIR